MEHSAPNSTPFPAKTYLKADMCLKMDKEQHQAETRLYKQVIGKCMYLATCTQPDIAWAVHELARFIANHGEKHWTYTKHLLQYLSSTQSISVILGHCDNPYPLLKALSDSDWVMGEHCKSISGFIISLNDLPISWSLKQQAVVTLSCEAEYISCTHYVKQILWLHNLLAELSFKQNDPTILMCDNTGTVACTHNPHSHTQMKHILT